MNGSKSGYLMLWGLILGFVVLALSGCVSLPGGVGLESMVVPAAPAAVPVTRPRSERPKPADADDNADDHRPWRWRKKLRAKYA